MSRSFSLKQLAEGIRQRDVGARNRQLTEKWNRTGLLTGLDGVKRENMATLLENQMAQVLKEANSLSTGGGNLTASGDIRGFTNIAFPIVRRVFGGLVANDLVSIQPMSLPSGLLFYLDYTYGTPQGGDGGALVNAASYITGSSIYGNPAGKGIRSGSLAVGGEYNLAGSGYSRVQAQSVTAATLLASGAFGGSGAFASSKVAFATGTDGKFLQFDPQITSLIEGEALEGSAVLSGTAGSFYFQILRFDSDTFPNIDSTLIKEVGIYSTDATTGNNVGVMSTFGDTFQGGLGLSNLRRLNQLGEWSGTNFEANALIGLGATGSFGQAAILAVITGSAQANSAPDTTQPTVKVSYVKSSKLDVNSTDGDTLTVPAFESNFGTDPSPAIPEIDIKIESVAVTAETRKLRARWSPELAQDLNAYHSLDAEVELTQILSEQVALEIDREILNDLLMGADTNYYWSRAPGEFVNKTNGSTVGVPSNASFTGSVREWYETLVETIIDVANEIHRKTLRGSANFIVVSPDVATMLEASVLYRPSYSIDGDGQVGAMTLGAEKVGTLSNRFTVYKDPYFPRNKVLVGYKGGSYLETGYVYAPYVPLIVTPTIFAPEDFTPRKGVMTRYGKKMVRNDFYGTVTVKDINII